MVVACYNDAMRHIVLGVCGSVAAYKAAYLIRLLKQNDMSVQAMMTPRAQNFIGAATLRALSGKPPAMDEWRQPLTADGIDHITLLRQADGLLIAPASADFLAKAATGMSDNLLLSSFLAATCPRWVAPAMNQQMWQAAVTQRNVQQLATDGVHILPPDSGEQACGETGPGRMMEPADIVRQVQERFWGKLAGRRVVVSTGATVEKIDDMRIISNISSGRMGFCVAEAAHNAGAEVMIIAGQTIVAPPPLPLRRALSSEEMLVAALEECRQADVFIAVAAVADFHPEQPVAGKIPRQKGAMSLQLTASEDILAAVSKQYPQLFTVGFSARNGTLESRIKTARQKMRRKKTAMFVANAAQDAGGDSSELALLTPVNEWQLPRQSKREAATALVAQVAAELVSRETSQEVQ